MSTYASVEHIASIFKAEEANEETSVEQVARRP
jgi:hypothetical protein